MITVCKIFRSQRGVAYLLVIAAIAFITPIVFDFFEETQMSRDLALNQRRWLQAYYLAKSGVNFEKLVLHRHKEKLAEYAKNATALQYLSANPIYKQVQLSTEALRSMITMSGEGGETTGGGETEESASVDDEDAGDGEGEEDKDESEEEEEKTNDDEDEAGEDGGEGDEEEDEGETSLLGTAGLSETAEIEEFLNFTGDFNVEVSEEQSKYSVNAFAKITPTSTGFDLHKKILYTLLTAPELKNFFKDQERDAEALVHAIADYVDANDVINEYEKAERGTEESVYKGLSYEPKSAPLMSVSELRLIPGMNDDILEYIKPYITVYHSGDEINVCLAEEKIVDALIVHYTTYSKCTNAIESDDTDYIEELRTEMLAACPDKDDVADTLNVKLGLKEAPMEDASTVETKKTSSMISGCELQFVNMLTEDNDVFRIQSHGQVNGVEAGIEMVIDTSNKKPSSWGVLYYQVF